MVFGVQLEVSDKLVSLHLDLLDLKEADLLESPDCVSDRLKHAGLLVLQHTLSEKSLNNPLDLLVCHKFLVYLRKTARSEVSQDKCISIDVREDLLAQERLTQQLLVVFRVHTDNSILEMEEFSVFHEA